MLVDSFDGLGCGVMLASIIIQIVVPFIPPYTTLFRH